MAGLFSGAAVVPFILVLEIAPAWYGWKVTIHVWVSRAAFGEGDFPVLIGRMVGGALTHRLGKSPTTLLWANIGLAGYRRKSASGPRLIV